jgi:L-asparaginase
MHERAIRRVFEDGVRGLAVIGFGRGNVPPVIVPALADAIQGGAIVTISSRCIAGRVRPRYGYEGGGLRLAEIGAVLAGDLSGAKARLLQMVSLGLTSDPAEAREVIQLTIHN